MKNSALLLMFMLLLGCRNSNPSDADSFPIEGEIRDFESILRHPISAANQLDSMDLAAIHFEVQEVNFDTIMMGEKVEFSFRFDNTGNNTLYILDTKVSCGCTVVSFPKEGISPGEKGLININFDSTGKFGIQDRSILVITNGIPNETLLRIKGFIKQN